MIKSKLLKYNIEDVVKPIQYGEGAGALVGAVAGAVKGPTLLGNYISGNVLGIQYASILGGFVGAIPGALAGYVATNTAYKLTKDIVKTSYNLIRHPIKSVKKLGSNIKSLVKRPYMLLTKPLVYMFVPVLKKKIKEDN